MKARDFMFLIAVVVVAGGTALWFANAVPPSSWAQDIPEDPHVTTERFCSFGMAKGEKHQKCEVPILPGCVVANFPGTKKPWKRPLPACASTPAPRTAPGSGCASSRRS